MAQRPGTQQQMQPVVCLSRRAGVRLRVVIETLQFKCSRHFSSLKFTRRPEHHVKVALFSLNLCKTSLSFSFLLPFFPPLLVFPFCTSAVAHHCSSPLPTGRGASTGRILKVFINHNIFFCLLHCSSNPVLHQI